ncbi:peptidase S15, partial [Mycobacterium sp. ITM-2017-0098]
MKQRRSSTAREQAPSDETVKTAEPETEIPDPAPEAELFAASTPDDKAELVSTVISNVVDPDSDTGDEPANPAESTLALTMLATARGKTDEEVSEPAAAQATASLATAAEYPIPTDVQVIEVTPPLEWLQTIPVLGRFVVTPIVSLIHVLPFVSEFLHPLIGFPIDHDAPPGTPRARTVKVVSFDGAEINVNFMPAKGLQAGQAAPTVLSGPGVGLPGATTLGLDVDGFLPHDVVGIGMLRKAGYNVV